ncbi:3-oxoacyl-ACP synthase III family protein [Phenylobacterium sp.]|uniref:3-oxoacyl-ACP synthase III family protein n=1 Tax=Phenylobacterium sp. TaxID=1871053 RepID=UPI003569192B
MSLGPGSGVCITGVGHHLAGVVEENDALCRGLDITPEWILEKTGIKRRYIAAPEDSASDFAVSAARRAMEGAGVTAEDIDLIVAATFSGDYTFPPLSAKIHKELGVKGGQIFDLQANCAGFVSALTAASDRMAADPSVRNALVIGVELNSRYIDRTNADSVIYHSDGAGAAVLSRGAPGAGIVASAFHTDSSNYEAVRVRGGGSSFPAMGRGGPAASDAMELNGLATWKQAITHLPATVKAACRKADVELADVDFFVFHQANWNLIDYIVRKMGADLSRTYTNVQEIGNTGAASVAIALSEAVDRDLIKPGSTVVLAAVGAGFNFGASVWRWAPVNAGRGA